MKRAGCLKSKVLRTLAVLLPILAVLTLSTPAMAAPVITMSPTTGASGALVTITGTNFESYRGDKVSIYFDNDEIASSPLTVPSGTFNVGFIIPAGAAPGRHWVRVRSDTGSTLASSVFIVPETEIKLNIAEGPVGTLVMISGMGFYAGKMVNIYFYDIIGEKVGVQMATAVGEFNYQFMIPAGTAGKHRILAQNEVVNSAEAEFGVIPSVALNLASGGPGDILTISGAGFGHRSNVHIYFGTAEAAYAKSDRSGNFEVAFNVPKMNPDTYYVKAVDGEGNTDRAGFTITAGVSLNETSGPIGTELVVKGSGFEAGGTVAVSYDALQVATAATDGNGAFSATFNVPTSIGGKHVVTVSDGSITRQFSFTVESVPPEIPAPLLPADVSQTKSLAYFDWTDVADPSQPVTYNLQVASDQNFASVVLAKGGLTQSEYALTGEEKLAAKKGDAPYYWRIKAVDGASNESEWSIPRLFYVAVPAVPQLLLPETGSKQEALVHFDWEDVAVISQPVTYNLQVASDRSFASIVLKREGLAQSEYTLADEEKLAAVKEEAPYYWRVRAIDGDANAGDWSEPASFYVAFAFALPGWALYTLIGLGALLVAFLAFVVGKRTAYVGEEEEEYRQE